MVRISVRWALRPRTRDSWIDRSSDQILDRRDNRTGKCGAGHWGGTVSARLRWQTLINPCSFSEFVPVIAGGRTVVHRSWEYSSGHHRAPDYLHFLARQSDLKVVSFLQRFFPTGTALRILSIRSCFKEANATIISNRPNVL